jgi:hypothetical protein
VAAYPKAAQQSPAPLEAQAKTDSSTDKKDSSKSADSARKAPAPAAPGTSAAAPKPAPTHQAPPTSSGGMVWVNTDTGVYQKPGSRYCGKTKVGKYMTEADAKKAGYHAAKKQ